MKTVYALTLVGLLAMFSPAADARKLMQSSATTDADILNFALNLEVGLALSVSQSTCLPAYSAWPRFLQCLASLPNRLC